MSYQKGEDNYKLGHLWVTLADEGFKWETVVKLTTGIKKDFCLKLNTKEINNNKKNLNALIISSFDFPKMVKYI